MNAIKMNEYKKQPFFFVDETAYERMLAKLHNGEPFVKTYLTTCPHGTNEEKCKCEFFKNVLHDGMIMRDVDGEMKPVITPSLLRGAMKRM